MDDKFSAPIRAVCDTGAQKNLMTNQCAKSLHLCKEASKIRLRAANGSSIHTKGKVRVQIWHRSKDILIMETTFIVMDGELAEQPFCSLDRDYFAEIGTSELADPDYGQRRTVDALLDAGIWAKIVNDEIIRHTNGMIAQSSSFGWLIFGSNIPDNDNDASCLHVANVDCRDIESLIQKLWEVEDIPSAHLWTAEEQFCEDNFLRTHSRNADGRYVVTLPLKVGQTLGESRNIALRRFYCLEARLARDPVLRANYQECMEGYQMKQQMVLADVLQRGTMHNYIPYQHVARKFRIVFDGSAKTSNGKSLNDIQHVGPRLQKDLMDIILNFRTHRIAMSADIVKMFHQVALDPAHWNLQRIFWRADPKEPLREYYLTVVTFGLASSPYNAVRALIQCARDHRAEFPRAASIVENDFYMDDLLTGANSQGEAVTLRREIIELLRKAGFELAKWRANRAELMEEELEDQTLELSENTSVLGVSWNYRDDVFCFKVQNRPQPAKLSKRLVTSEAARVFDPQGYLSPITIRAKLFIQELWRSGQDWDAPLDKTIQGEWREFYAELQKLEDLRIVRWIGTESNRDIQIHIFADASSKAYGAVAYARVRIDNKWEAKLLFSRSRVAPVRALTIPRLELCAAELASKMMPKIRSVPAFQNAPISLWSDSKVVLCWLWKPVNQLKTFVANRVSRIIGRTDRLNWRHVATQENPADLISRGVRVERLLDETFWWSGPDFLRQEETTWPNFVPNLLEEPVEPECEIEMKEPVRSYNVAMLTTIRSNNKEYDLIESRSLIDSVSRITAYVIRFCRYCYEPIRKRKNQPMRIFGDKYESVENSNNNTDLIITPMEIDFGLLYWVRESQKQSFPNEYRTLEKGKEITGSSRLKQLSPFLDKMGIMRIKGRLANTSLTEDQRQPMILCYKSTLANRLAYDAHISLAHGGPQLCLQYLRNRFWIVCGRILVRQIVRSCVPCCRYNQESPTQLMADLPAARVNPAPAFFHTGVDYAGPTRLKIGRNSYGKGYIAVFVCMVYKAVHLEVVKDLSSNSFLDALTRFIARHAGAVGHMYSDNGRNFVGAQRILNEARELWMEESVIRHLTNYKIEWHFNTPVAPHHGGLWEAAVKSMKKHLNRIAGANTFTYEQLDTVLTRITAVLNSRPLTPMTSDPTDLLTLTPGHFLVGQSMVLPYMPRYVDTATNRLDDWQRLQKINQEFWERWSQEYILEQQRRVKWANSKESIKVGDLVFIKNELTPPCQWLMGRIVEVFPGKDDLIRSARIRTANSELTRPITQICVLPIDGASTE